MPDLPQARNKPVFCSTRKRCVHVAIVPLQVEIQNALKNQRSDPRGVVFRIIIKSLGDRSGRGGVQSALQNLRIGPEDVVLSSPSSFLRPQSGGAISQIEIPVHHLTRSM